MSCSPSPNSNARSSANGSGTRSPLRNAKGSGSAAQFPSAIAARPAWVGLAETLHVINELPRYGDLVFPPETLRCEGVSRVAKGGPGRSSQHGVLSAKKDCGLDGAIVGCQLAT